jgi:hypothetical protein
MTNQPPTNNIIKTQNMIQHLNHLKPLALAVTAGVLLMSHTPAPALDIAGSLLIDLNYQVGLTTISESGETRVTSWTNSGTMGGSFVRASASPYNIYGISTSLPPFLADKGGFNVPNSPDGLRCLISTVATPAALSGANLWSMEIWFWVNTGPRTDRRKFFAWTENQPDDGKNAGKFGEGPWAVMNAASQYISVPPDMLWDPADSGAGPSIGVWHHGVVTYDGTTENVYLDGVPKNTQTVALNISPLLYYPILFSGLIEATPASGSASMNGAIAALRVHSGALTAGMVLNNYTLGIAALPGPTYTISGTVSTYDFADPVGALVQLKVGANVVAIQTVPSDGAYSFSVSPGTYTVRASKAPYLPIESSDIVVTTSNVTQDIVLLQDTTPPVWASGWPLADFVTTSGFTARAKTNEVCNAYYVVLADGATAPSPAAMKTQTVPGALKSGSMVLATANTEVTADVTGLTPNSFFDVWFVAEDPAGNLQASPVKVDVGTLDGPVEWAGPKFKATTPVALDRLGNGVDCVDISGNIGIAGGWAAPNPATDTGKAYLFDVTTGLQTVPLEPKGGLPASALFGIGTAIDGNLAVVGARGVNKAYLFDASTGNPRGVISRLAGSFGSCVALSGNKLVVGSEGEKKFYVYDVSDPDFPVQLGASAIFKSDKAFATCVALDGNTMIAGARDAAPNYSGKAWLWDLSGLTAGAGTPSEVQLDPVYPPSGGEQPYFGVSVDIEGGRAIVGACLAGDPVINGPLWNAGMAFLFDVSNPASPTKLAQIVPDTRFFNQRFGETVAISGNTVIIGTSARYASDAPWNLPPVLGEAYLYDISTPATPSLIQKLSTPSVNWWVNQFGSPVAIDGNVALVGAASDDTGAADSGAVYIYSAPPPAGYTSWAGAGVAFDDDANNDGVANGMAWVLGATDKDANATSLLPTLDNTDPNYFIFTYNRKDDANTDTNTTIKAEYSSDLATWTEVVAGPNIIIAVTPDGAGAGIDSVEVKIKRTLAVGGKLFVRLNVTQNLGGVLTYSISGKVTLNGVGLAGVTVSDGTRSAVTAAAGTYTITGVPDAATYTVTPSLSGYSFTPANASVPVMGVNVTGKDFTAAVAAGYASWAATNAGSQPADQDFNHDGVANGVAYFMNKTGLATNPGIVGGSVTWPNGAKIPKTEYGAGKQFVVQTSSDLQMWNDVPGTGDSNLILTDYSAGSPPVEASVKYTLPTGEPKIFVRLKVTPK